MYKRQRWTFATTQTTLDSVSAQAPNSLTPYQFTLPADCLRVLDVDVYKRQGHGNAGNAESQAGAQRKNKMSVHHTCEMFVPN